MNKKAVYFLLIIGLLALAGNSFAQVRLENPLQGVNNFTDLFGKIISTVGILIAGLGTIMLIVAGILYVTSAGSPEKVGTAKKALIYAVAGIVIGLAASGIVELIKTTIGAP
jgi:hypothetical protein